MIERTRFRSTVFLCSEFKLENIYSEVNFCGKNVCGNFYLRELIFADRWKNRKNFVPHGRYVDRPTRLEILHSFIFIHNCIR